jgi:hypothetical protein
MAIFIDEVHVLFLIIQQNCILIIITAITKSRMAVKGR